MEYKHVDNKTAVCSWLDRAGEGERGRKANKRG